jgi:hypothetical protein
MYVWLTATVHEASAPAAQIVRSSQPEFTRLLSCSQIVSGDDRCVTTAICILIAVAPPRRRQRVASHLATAQQSNAVIGHKRPSIRLRGSQLRLLLALCGKALQSV